jgi:hypothetical protein
MTRELALGLGLAVGVRLRPGHVVYVWRHRAAAGGTSLVVTLLGIFVWTSCYGRRAQHRHRRRPPRLWSGLKFVGLVTVPGALWVLRAASTRPDAG